MVAFLKKHYEKLIVGVLLVVFIVFLISLRLLVQESNDIKVQKDGGVREFNANYKKQAQNYIAEKTFSSYNKWYSREDLNPQVKGKGGKTPAGNAKPGTVAENERKEDFVIPYQITVCPVCKKAVPVRDFRQPDKNGKCYCSLKPREYSHVLQPPMVVVLEAADSDADKDGIPDSYENKLKAQGFSVSDPKDAELDFDNDFYFNAEEYFCDTDPMNPQLKAKDPVHGVFTARFPGRLPYSNLLRVKNVTRREYSLMLMSVDVSRNNPNSRATKFTVQFFELRELSDGSRKKRPRQKHFYIGDQIDSLSDHVKIIGVEAKSSAGSDKSVDKEYLMKVQDIVTGEVFSVGKQERIYSPTQEVEFFFRPEKNSKKIKIGEKFSLGNDRTGVEQYTLIGADRKEVSAEIEDASGKRIRITRTMQFSKILKDCKLKKKDLSGPKTRLEKR